MLNREVFHTDPREYRIANEGVAKVVFPPPPEVLATLRGELQTFVCDGAYARGLARILEAFTGAVGRSATVPAAWISGFFGSGKSHLASMLAALWTDLPFPDGATAEGLVPQLPKEVLAPLRELRGAGRRMGGLLACGDTLGQGPVDPLEATLGIIFRAAGLPMDLRAAEVAFWLDDLGILGRLRENLGARFETDIRTFVLSPRFADAVLAARPDIAANRADLQGLLKAQFAEPPPVTAETLVRLGTRALKLGRKEIPLTLIVLDEVQQFIRTNQDLTLRIQGIAETLSARFDGRVLLVCTGQQALSDADNLQKLLGRFPVQVALGEADIDAVIRRTVLRKKPQAEPAIAAMLANVAGEVSRHLRGSRLAHGHNDDRDAVLDWPLLPSRRRVWEAILRELDRTGLGGTLRGQLRTALAAAQAYADRPLGHAVPGDFLYDRFAAEAVNAGLLPGESRSAIEKLRGGNGDDPLKARILMLVYMLGRIQGSAEFHGVAVRAETIADLLVVDLAGEPELRRKVPMLLEAMQNDGLVIEAEGGWRLQTRESAEWEQAFRTELAAKKSDSSEVARRRSEMLDAAIGEALKGATRVQQGSAKVPREIHRLRPGNQQTGDQQTGDKRPADGVPLFIHSGWEESLAAREVEIAAAPPGDAAIHLLIPQLRAEDLNGEVARHLAATAVLWLKGVAATDAGKEAQSAMRARADRARQNAETIVRQAVEDSQVLQAGGSKVDGPLAEAVKTAAQSALARLYLRFAEADHPAWGKAREDAYKKHPDALAAVGHHGPPEAHPVCREILKTLGAGKKGSELRALFEGPRFGWPQDAVDAALAVLANAGHLRVSDETGRPVVLADQPRAKIGPFLFRPETRLVSVAERIAVRGLLADCNVPFENNQESASLPLLMERLAAAAAEAGGEPPAPPSPSLPDAPLPDAALLVQLTGNELLALLAQHAAALRAALPEWRAAKAKIAARLPGWKLAERLVAAGAETQAPALAAIRESRWLLAEPDPVPPLIAAAAEALRRRINAAYETWQGAWERGEKRLHGDAAWNRLSPEQKHAIRGNARLLAVERPGVATPEAIAAALEAQSLEQWQTLAQALPVRLEEAIGDAVRETEPKAQRVEFFGRLLRTEEDVDAWLAELRASLLAALAAGPVLPKI